MKATVREKEFIRSRATSASMRLSRAAANRFEIPPQLNTATAISDISVSGWRQSGANRSHGLIPCYQGLIQGFFMAFSENTPAFVRQSS
jgi:hypothetical protein